MGSKLDLRGVDPLQTKTLKRNGWKYQSSMPLDGSISHGLPCAIEMKHPDQAFTWLGLSQKSHFITSAPGETGTLMRPVLAHLLQHLPVLV